MLIFSGHCDGIRLENVETTLDKSIKTVVHKYEKCCDSKLVEFYNSTNESRREEQQIFCKDVQNITKALKVKVDLLKNRKMGEIKDFEAFKKEMIDIQENILNLKKNSKSELQKLNSLENELQDELELYYNIKTIEWSGTYRNIDDFHFIPPKIKTKPLSGECKEVRQFFDFVHESGGHENGWRQDDHLFFLKMRKKCKNADELANQIHEVLPDLSVEVIKEHSEWYKQYLKLQNKKKDAILKWKQNRSLSSNSDKTLLLSNKSSETLTAKTNKKNNTDLKEQLIHWKVEKEEKLLLELEIEKQRAMEKIEKERLKRRKQNEMKKLVNEWKESKKLFEQCQKQQEQFNEELEKKRRAVNANRMIKQFRSMDEMHILRMRQVRSKSEEKLLVKRVQSGPPISRDPKRLLKPTVQWTQRVRALKEPLAGWPVISVPKLGVPDWRKNVT